MRVTLLLLELTKTLHTYWLVARLDPLSMAELLTLQGTCQPLRAKPAHFVSHLPESSRKPLLLSLQFTRYRWKMPDEERFYPGTVFLCSRLRAMFHICGLNLLTS